MFMSLELDMVVDRSVKMPRPRSVARRWYRKLRDRGPFASCIKLVFGPVCVMHLIVQNHNIQ